MYSRATYRWQKSTLTRSRQTHARVLLEGGTWGGWVNVVGRGEGWVWPLQTLHVGQMVGSTAQAVFEVP